MTNRMKNDNLGHCTKSRLDPRVPADRMELALAFGWEAAWNAAIRCYEHDIATCTHGDARHPSHRLQKLLNAARFELLWCQRKEEGAAPEPMPSALTVQPAGSPNLVRAVRYFAETHYEQDGWDIVVETYEDADILEAIGDATTEADAIRAVRSAVQPQASYRADIVATADW